MRENGDIKTTGKGQEGRSGEEERKKGKGQKDPTSQFSVAPLIVGLGLLNMEKGQEAF